MCSDVISLKLNSYLTTTHALQKCLFIYSAYVRSGLNCIKLYYCYYEDFVILWCGFRLEPLGIYVGF
jgi:hypothetical protein